MSDNTDNNPKTWWVDDLEFFPASILGLRKPDVGFFVAVEGQSTDDGKVFINALQDQEDLQYVGGFVAAVDAERIMGQAKTALRSRSFKEWVAHDQSEHGVALWTVSAEQVFVLAFGTQRATELTEKVMEWLAETDLPYESMKKGCGTLIAGEDVPVSLGALPTPAPVKASRFG